MAKTVIETALLKEIIHETITVPTTRVETTFTKEAAVENETITSTKTVATIETRTVITTERVEVQQPPLTIAMVGVTALIIGLVSGRVVSARRPR